MRRRILVLITLLALVNLTEIPALSAPPSETEGVPKLSKMAVFNSPGDLFYVSDDLIYSYGTVGGKSTKYAFRKSHRGWERATITNLPALRPVALGACDPLNQVDIGIQHPEFDLLPSVAGHNLKQVIETGSYALLVVLARGSSAGGGELSMILAVPKGSGWVQANVLPISPNAQFCVAQSLETSGGNQSIFVFYNEVAGSGESFGVATFDLDTPKVLGTKH